jgi:hypothetical protein
MSFGKKLLKWILIGMLGILIGCSLFKKKKDTTPPLVDILTPTDSIWFNGNIYISVSAYDSVGVKSILIFGDDILLGSDTTADFALTWKLPEPAAFSWHTIYAKAYDEAQNEGVSTILDVFYIGRQEISIYHGTATISGRDYFYQRFSAEINDSLYGSTLVNNQDSLGHFYLMTEANFNDFKRGDPFTHIIEINNFRQFQTNHLFTEKGKYVLVWQNLTSIEKSAWIRFYLSRP